LYLIIQTFLLLPYHHDFSQLSFYYLPEERRC
jgi:hypothetical protein